MIIGVCQMEIIIVTFPFGIRMDVMLKVTSTIRPDQSGSFLDRYQCQFFAEIKSDHLINF